MRFLNPGALHLLWLLVVPVVLYLYRRQARQVSVSTLLFFRSLAQEHRESSWLRLLKRWLSLLLTLLILIGVILTLARPSGGTGDETGASVVIVVDRSASMAASDGTSSRLDRVRHELKRRLRELPAEVAVSLVAFDAEARVVAGRSRNHRECERRLDDLEVVPVGGRPEKAWKAAQRLAELDPHSRIWWGSDQRPPQEDLEGLSIVMPGLESEGSNVGITAFQLRPAPVGRGNYEGFLRVEAAGGNLREVKARVEVSVAGRLAQLRDLTLAAGESVDLTLPFDAAKGQLLEVQLKPEGPDRLGLDNAVTAWLPEVRPLRVGWVSRAADPFVDLGLGSLVESDRLELLKAEASEWPLNVEVDVWVLENFVPDPWPSDRPVVWLRPPQSAGGVQVRPFPGRGVPQAAVRVLNPDHPVLYRTSASRVVLTQTAEIGLPQGVEPLWQVGDAVVLAAGELNGQRLVLGAFSPAGSETLALLPVFPLMLGNALYWCGEDPALRRGLEQRKPGEVLPGQGSLEWHSWDGARFLSVTDRSGQGLPLNRIGAWRTEDGRSGFTMVGSPSATDLVLQSHEPKPAGAAVQLAEVGTSWVWTIAELLLCGVLFLLLLESFLFHRKALY